MSEFQSIDIKKAGRYRLVLEENLEFNLNNSDWETSGLRIPEKLTLVFLVRYYRLLIYNLTQAQLAEKTGLTPNQISAIEKGNTKPQRKTLDKLGEVLGEDFLKLAVLSSKKL